MLQEISLILFAILSIFFFNSPKTTRIYSSVSVVIPAYNEEKSIKHVIDTVKKVKEITEIIVVDDGSTDNTYNIVSKFHDVKLLHHKLNKGKGSAMKTGLKKVTNEVVLFLDADLSEINPSQISTIIKPILNGSADIVKTKFKREAGRVTELTAKPLLQFFFPELSFEQPLSGQFAAKKDFLDDIDLEHDYGVDIGIVLDADAQGKKIEEVDIGNIVHEMSTLKELNLMANEVVRTIVDRAINYGRLTMMDDFGNAITMEIMGMSLVTFGIFGLFFIKFLTPIISGLFIVIGLIIASFYLYKLIKMSLRIYKQSKVSSWQMIKSFINMHFPVLISILLLLLLLISLIGSVSISSTEISIEPASKNLVISTDINPRSTVDVRGPYTIESALENEEHLIRLSNSALNTLQAQYGDYVYIDETRYQLEQSVNNETDLIRIPETAREALDVNIDSVIRDSDLRSVFEGAYIVRNIKPNPNNLGNNNHSNININYNATNVSIGSQIVSQAQPDKILNVYVNDTLISSTSGVITNNSYTIYLDGVSSKYLRLNTSSDGLIYNKTYKNSTIQVVLEDTESNSTFVFANDKTYVRFLNINIGEDTSNYTQNNTTNYSL